MEWADLATIDMSHAHTLEGRKALVKQVHDAIKSEGFLYVVNHGLTSEQVCFCFRLRPTYKTYESMEDDEDV